MKKRFVILVTEIDDRLGTCVDRYLTKENGMYSVCRVSDMQHKALSVFSRRLAAEAIKEAELQIKKFGTIMREPVKYRFTIEEKIY